MTSGVPREWRGLRDGFGRRPGCPTVPPVLGILEILLLSRKDDGEFSLSSAIQVAIDSDSNRG